MPKKWEVGSIFAFGMMYVPLVKQNGPRTEMVARQHTHRSQGGK